MRMIDHRFEEKTKKLAYMMNLQQGESTMVQARNERGAKFDVVEKCSPRVTDRDVKIMDKAHSRKSMTQV
jgi:hypothetical protein